MMQRDAGLDRDAKPTHLPGEPGIWVFVAGDLIVFTIMFALFLLFCSFEPAIAARSRLTLSQPLGLLNTALLLSSSCFVAHAVRAVRVSAGRYVRPLLFAAIGCAVGFGVVKVVEWHAKLASGITPTSNQFFTFYFALTGIHMIHVIIGTGLLAMLAGRDWRQSATASRWLVHLESGATFWHMVDLLWIALFGLLYLLP